MAKPKDYAARVEKIRGGIEDAKAERHAVGRMLRPAAEAKATLRASVEQHAARYRPEVGRFVAAGGSDRVPELPLMIPRRHDLAEHARWAETLCGLAGPLIVERFEIAIDAALEGRETISDAERAARIAELDTKLDELEREEERTICEAEAAGVETLRRGDARPELVLEWRGAA